MGAALSGKTRVVNIGSFCTSFKPTNGVIDRPDLAKIDCQSLRRSWEIIAPDDMRHFEILYELGIEIYDRIFSSHPELLSFFPSLLDASKKSTNIIELRNIAAFRNQALRLVDVLTRGVQTCENMGQLEPHLRDLGRRHRMYVGNALGGAHFKVIEQSTLTVIKARLEQYSNTCRDAHLEDGQMEEMMKSWSSLMEHIIFHIQEGYNESDH